MNWRAFGETFGTLFVITDLVGNAPIFVSITRTLTPRQRQRAAVRAVLAAVACVGVALLLAERVTRATSPAVLSFLTRVFGLLLSAIAVQLVVDGVKSLT